MTLDKDQLLGTWTNLGKGRSFIIIDWIYNQLVTRPFTVDGSYGTPAPADAPQLPITRDPKDQSIFIKHGNTTWPYIYTQGSDGSWLTPPSDSTSPPGIGTGLLCRFGQIVEYDIDETLQKALCQETITATGKDSSSKGATSSSDGHTVEAVNAMAMLLRYNLPASVKFAAGEEWISWNSGKAPSGVITVRVDDQTAVIFDNNTNATAKDLEYKFKLWAAPKDGSQDKREIDPTLINKGDE